MHTDIVSNCWIAYPQTQEADGVRTREEFRFSLFGVVFDKTDATGDVIVSSFIVAVPAISCRHFLETAWFSACTINYQCGRHRFIVGYLGDSSYRGMAQCSANGRRLFALI